MTSVTNKTRLEEEEGPTRRLTSALWYGRVFGGEDTTMGSRRRERDEAQKPPRDRGGVVSRFQLRLRPRRIWPANSIVSTLSSVSRTVALHNPWASIHSYFYVVFLEALAGSLEATSLDFAGPLLVPHDDFPCLVLFRCMHPPWAVRCASRGQFKQAPWVLLLLSHHMRLKVWTCNCR